MSQVDFSVEPVYDLDGVPQIFILCASYRVSVFPRLPDEAASTVQVGFMWLPAAPHFNMELERTCDWERGQELLWPLRVQQGWILVGLFMSLRVCTAGSAEFRGPHSGSVWSILQGAVRYGLVGFQLVFQFLTGQSSQALQCWHARLQGL